MFSLSKLRYWAFGAVLCVLAYSTSYSYANNMWGAGSVLIVFALITLTLLLFGISLQSTAFAAVATLPNLNSYISLSNFSLTLTEMFMTLFITIFLLKNAKIVRNRLAFLLFGLYFSCLASLIGSPLGFSSMGMLLRFGVLLTFITILVSQHPEKELFKPLFFGLLAIPFVACSTYAGEGILAQMFTANLIDHSRALYSFQYPIWFAFLLPFLVFIRASRVVIFLASLFIAMLVVLAFARSILIGAAAAALLFIIFHKDNKPMVRFFAKSIAATTLGIAFFTVIVIFNVFSFTNTDSFTDEGEQDSKVLSNIARWERVSIAVSVIKDHPLFGAGFGTSNENTFAERQERAQAFAERISPEFGPLSVLTEIGSIGGLFLFCIIAISFMHSAKCLRSREIPMAYKLAVLVAFGGFVSSFINSNSLTLILIYLFLVTPVIIYKHWNHPPKMVPHE